jgi:hypothetical protein
MRLVLALLLVVSCKKSSEQPPPPPSAPVAAPVVAADDPGFPKLRDDIIEYTGSMIPLLAAFDGDCTAQIERMKKLEPLVDKIREETAKAAPDYDAKIRQYLTDHKVEVVGKIDAQLAAAKLTRPQLEAKDADIKAKCKGADYAAEMDRIGIMKK